MKSTILSRSLNRLARIDLTWVAALVMSTLAMAALGAFQAPQDGVLLASNTLLTITMITREALRVLKANLSFTGRIRREFNDKFGVEGAKIGTVLNVRKPPRYIVKEGQALQLQDATETQVPVTLDTQAHVDITFSTADLALNIDDFSKRFIAPAIAAIANRIDQKGLQLYKQVAQTVGTPQVTPSALMTYLLAGVKLDDSLTPMDGQRSIVISPLMQATIVDALKGLFQQAAAIAQQYMKGRMGTAIGFDWYMDQNVATHTVGPLGGTPLVNVGGQTGSNIVTDGWTAAAALRLREGDVIQFAGVYSINPQSREATESLQDFVVTANVSSDSSGNATIPIYPPIITSGADQTVSGSPDNDAVITIFGHASSHANKLTRQGLAFHQDAFTLVTADLPLPRGVDMAARVNDDDSGISIRAVRQYTIENDNLPCRFDVLFGWAVLRPELACRICG